MMIRRLFARLATRRRYVRDVHFIESEMDRLSVVLIAQDHRTHAAEQRMREELATVSGELDNVRNQLATLRDRFRDIQNALGKYETEIEGLRSLKSINEDVQIPALVSCIKRLQSIYDADVATQVRRSTTSNA